MAKAVYKYTDDFINKLAKKLLVFAETAKPVPFLKDFCYQNKIPSEEISRKCSDNPNFKRALNILKDKQEMTLVFGGLTGKFNASFAIFTLKNVAGWRDQKEDKEDDERLNDQVDFVGVPNKEGNGRFKRFLS